MKKRLLVVDDNRGIRLLLKELFWDEGYEVLEAADGQEALSLIASCDLSLVLLDIKMPGISGIQVLDIAAAFKPDLPFILMSAYSEVYLLNRALELHPKTLFVSKPFNLDQVRALVNDLFNHLALEYPKEG